MGTSPFARIIFESLISIKKTSIKNFNVVAVVTQPDRPAGRGKKLQASAVKQLATESNLNLYQPNNINSEDSIAVLKSLQADVIVVVAFGQILKAAVLNTAKLECINVHASLLPRWRGAAPIQRALAAGDTTTGIAIMRMVSKLDAGDIMLSKAINILKDDTAATLEQRLAQLAATLLPEAINGLATANWQQQDEAKVTYAHKVLPEQAQLDFTKPAATVCNMVRAMTTKPGAWLIHNGNRIKLAQPSITTGKTTKAGEILSWGDNLTIQCADNAICFNSIQYPSKKMLAISQFSNGRKDLFKVGEVIWADDEELKIKN